MGNGGHGQVAPCLGSGNGYWAGYSTKLGSGGLGWGWAAQRIEKKGRGKKRLAGPDSVSSWVSARYQIGTRKILFFFKYFYNLQTNLNSIQI
jgi:hypothetical protein